MRLEEFCKKNRWHYSEIAREIEYSGAHIRNIAHGKVRASLRTAKAIELFTKGEVTVQEILNEYKEPIETQQQQ